MKVSSWIALLPLLVSLATGASLETLLRQPDARVAWSKEVARLESGESRAIFVALAVEKPPQRLRGLRIDFSDRGWARSVYIDEDKLEPIKALLDRLSLDIDRPVPLLAPRNGEGYLGLCEFRDDPKAYPLHFDYQYSAWPALRITNPTQISFAGRKPSDLAEILVAVMQQLKVR